jgi:hypothetical protein
VWVRGGGLGGAEDAQRRGDIGTRLDGRALETAQKTWVDVLGHRGEGDDVMCASPARKPGSIGRYDGLASVMAYLARMART